MSTPFDVSPTVGSTDAAQQVANSQQVSTPFQQQSVNAAQSNNATQFVTQVQHQQELAALRASYEARISNLMSEKDRAINERDKAISAHANLLQEYEAYKAMNSSSLAAAVEAGQSSVNSNKALQQQVNELNGQVIRYKVLLEKPHLAAYQRFIPASGTEEDITNAVQQLEEIRNADMQRSGYPVQGTFVGNNALAGTGQGTQLQQGQQQANGNNPLGNLYQGRTNLPQSLQQGMPGSSPSMMNPNADIDPTSRIKQLFADAQASSDPGAFQKAVDQAKVLADASINQSMGRAL